MFKEYIIVEVFLISLSIGLLYVYLVEPKHQIIQVYPTPYNHDKIQFRDKADNCYSFKPTIIPCPEDKTKVKRIPMQK